MTKRGSMGERTYMIRLTADEFAAFSYMISREWNKVDSLSERGYSGYATEAAILYKIMNQLEGQEPGM